MVKLADEIVNETPKECIQIAGQNDKTEFVFMRTEALEKLIAAKLEPVREILQRVVRLGDGTVIYSEDYALELVGQALALLSEEE